MCAAESRGAQPERRSHLGGGSAAAPRCALALSAASASARWQAPKLRNSIGSRPGGPCLPRSRAAGPPRAASAKCSWPRRWLPPPVPVERWWPASVDSALAETAPCHSSEQYSSPVWGVLMQQQPPLHASLGARPPVGVPARCLHRTACALQAWGAGELGPWAPRLGPRGWGSIPHVLPLAPHPQSHRCPRLASVGALRG